MTELVPGLVGEASQLVTDDLTAASLGSGLVAAFSTPALVALCEHAAFEGTRPYLAPGQTTVGMELNLKHLAATPPGMRVRARAELTRVEGRRLYFKIEAWDERDKIGEGTHARMIVDEDKFNARLQDKRGGAGH